MKHHDQLGVVTRVVQNGGRLALHIAVDNPVVTDGVVRLLLDAYPQAAHMGEFVNWQPGMGGHWEECRLNVGVRVDE